MRNNEFTLNDRFLVNADLNLVKDLESNTGHRLEPRQIRVLLMLVEHKGELVKRDWLITEIWNDYGGAEDGLTQAISVIRKTLQDTERKVIETIPKKGYILHATISSVEDKKAITPNKKFNSKLALAAAVTAVILFFAGYLLKNNASISQDKLVTSTRMKMAPEKQSTDIDFTALKPEEEDYSNTITTIDPAGTRYRLVAVGDQRPKFWVNGKLIAGSEIEKYAEIEGNLLRQLWDRQTNPLDTLHRNVQQ